MPPRPASSSTSSSSFSSDDETESVSSSSNKTTKLVRPADADEPSEEEEPLQAWRRNKNHSNDLSNTNSETSRDDHDSRSSHDSDEVLRTMSLGANEEALSDDSSVRESATATRSEGGNASNNSRSRSRNTQGDEPILKRQQLQQQQQQRLHQSQLLAFQIALLDQNWDTLLSLLEENPELARCEVRIQCHGEKTPVLPLHAVVSASASPAITRTSSSRRNKQRQQLQRSGCPVDVVERLIMMHPAALQTGDKNRQRWPLHFALSCRGRASLALIKYLVRCAPAALQQVDGQGCLPLHYAAQYASSEVCRFLLDAHPAACQQPIKGKGRYMLHLLAARGGWDDNDTSLELLRRALDAYPTAISLPDCHGRLPLHHAAVQTPHPTWNVLDLLVQAHSPALLVKDHVGPHTPLTAYKWIQSRCSSSYSTISTVCSSSRATAQQQQQHHDNDVVAVYLQERTAKERRKHRAGAIEKFFTIKIPLLRQQQQQNSSPQKTTTTTTPASTSNKRKARTRSRTAAASSSLLYCYG